jgi:hypothetical protein
VTPPKPDVLVADFAVMRAEITTLHPLQGQFLNMTVVLQDYDEWFPPVNAQLISANQSNCVTNSSGRDAAQWCLFDPILSVICGCRFQRIRAARICSRRRSDI